MSLDLLKEFGYAPQDNDRSPWNDSTTNDAKIPSSLEDDDFGEFEQAKSTDILTESSPKAMKSDALAVSLVSLTWSQTFRDAGKPPPSPTFQALNSSLKLAIPAELIEKPEEQAKKEMSTPVTAWPSFGRDRSKSVGKPLPLSPYTDDEWGDFIGDSAKDESIVSSRDDDFQPDRGKTMASKPRQHASLLDLDVVDSQPKPTPNTMEMQVSTSAQSAQEAGEEFFVPRKSKIPNSEPPPSNVPPPSILLSLLSSIFHSLPTEIKRLVLSIDTTVVTSLQTLSNHGRLEQLSTCLCVIRAAARIIAGRKVRWKRDVHLAQNMRIGPANSGKAGGMKLTGVDKSESRREDQEMAEVIRVWRQQVGGLKASIAKLNSQQSETEFALPIIREIMIVRIANAGEGAVTAPKSCFLCGLRRDERVIDLDVNVEDNFGEWWVDYWGHVDCKTFWEEYKDSLHQR
ncbi:MAG: hypothetical protein Q9190_001439 [Brigantiaea leucoxantha]